MPNASAAIDWLKRVWHRGLSFALSWLMRLDIRLGRVGVTDAGGPTVCVTSYGPRIKTCAIALMSIGRGTKKPGRLILWLDELPPEGLPAGLVRLRRRGLEILMCSNYGPHKKYYPYALLNLTGPLVTADDDILLPRTWLADLWAVHDRIPDAVIAHRAHVISFATDGQIAPYGTWQPCQHTRPSSLVFPTGCGGVLYPDQLLRCVRVRGDSFMSLCARVDDVWLHRLALQAGIPAAQVSPNPASCLTVPGTQAAALWRENVVEAGNDDVIRRLYGATELAALNAAACG